MTTLKVNIKLAENIAKKQNSNRGGRGGAPKSVTGDKYKSNKENAAHLALWKSKCIALKNIPPTPVVTSTKTFTKKEHLGFGTKSKPFHWFKNHLIWCVHNSDQCNVGNNQDSNRKNHRKPSSSSSTREQAMADMIDIFCSHDYSSDNE